MRTLDKKTRNKYELELMVVGRYVCVTGRFIIGSTSISLVLRGLDIQVLILIIHMVKTTLEKCQQRDNKRGGSNIHSFILSLYVT